MFDIIAAMRYENFKKGDYVYRYGKISQLMIKVIEPTGSASF